MISSLHLSVSNGRDLIGYGLISLFFGLLAKLLARMHPGQKPAIRAIPFWVIYFAPPLFLAGGLEMLIARH